MIDSFVGSVSSVGELVGSVVPEAVLSGLICVEQVLLASLCAADTAETYSGVYEITPGAEDRLLDVDGRIMKDDVIVKAVPYYETSNDKGITVIIGG